MKLLLRLLILGMMLVVCATIFAQKPDFSGSWAMDRARSFGLPGNMNQTMVITQTAAELTVETKLIQPGNERSVKDNYVLDGKEYEYKPPAPPNTAPEAAPKGKRTTSWLPNGEGFIANEVITNQSANGPTTTQITKKWTFTADGELTIAYFVDGPNGSYEAKRNFTRKKP